MLQLGIKYPFPSVISALREALIEAPRVDVGEWQARLGGPQSLTVEVEDVSFGWIIPIAGDLRHEIRPSWPWAEDHFQERVSGRPLNPSPSEAWWPYRVRGNEAHKQHGAFSHTYPERIWPREAGRFNTEPAMGIRFAYGDLGDVVSLLASRPHTRQAYLPIWFPEDTGATEGQRVPCTLGYHFLIRNNRLKIVYYIRSCDFLRHFRDDVYLACRLAQWVVDQVSEMTETIVTPSHLIMHISSLHVFESDVPRLRSARDLEIAEPRP
jgi:hypothetical protein